MFIKYLIIDLISLSFNNSFKIINYFLFKIDKLNVKSFYFEFNDDLKYRITSSIFLLNFLIKVFNKDLLII